MAKTYYKVPVALDRSFLDHEISLSGGGWQAKPMPMKQLLFFGGSMLVMLWAVTSTFISSADLLAIFAFLVWWLAATAFFGRLTKTKELKFKTVPAFLAYAPRTARQVMTRRSSNPSDFHSIVGIDSIADDGRIKFSDGTVGRAYLIVGSASILLFDEDRTAILERVDSFWRKVESSCEHIFVTTKEPQRIYQQVANLERRNRRLEVRDPDLASLMREQYQILTEHVGGEYNSIHQYLILKANSPDELRRGHNVVQAETEGSSLMIKEAAVLDRAATQAMLQVFYTGIETNPLPKPARH